MPLIPLMVRAAPVKISASLVPVNVNLPTEAAAVKFGSFPVATLKIALLVAPGTATGVFQLLASFQVVLALPSQTCA